VVNEAMSAGLPVIVSRACGCADDLVRDGENGFAVDHDDIPQIAEAVCRLEDAGPEGRAAMIERSREIVQDFAPERFAAGAVAAARTALQRRPRLPGIARRLVPAVIGRQFGA
jgi:glycosyltransferase involved in cell wall biosynthesis